MGVCVCVCVDVHMCKYVGFVTFSADVSNPIRTDTHAHNSTTKSLTHNRTKGALDPREHTTENAHSAGQITHAIVIGFDRSNWVEVGRMGQGDEITRGSRIADRGTRGRYVRRWC